MIISVTDLRSLSCVAWWMVALGSGHFFIQEVSRYTYFGRGAGPFEDLLKIKVASTKNVIFLLIQYVRKFRRVCGLKGHAQICFQIYFTTVEALP
jgi:hypothetical protein